jgi:indole-3-glycerol phosphate synthase
MLDTIVVKKRQTVAAAKQKSPLEKLAQHLEPGNFLFSAALLRSDWSLIAECKLASPVKGRLCDRYSVSELAKLYAANGAAALSVLTDEHFLGSLEDLTSVRQVTSLPLLRKDFIIDEYQIYEARAAGADAVLLIARILSPGELSRFLAVAHDLGMDCLVEIHDREELDTVLVTDAKIIGINNRNLQNFTTDINQTFELLPYLDGDRLVISESGIRSREDILRLRAAGVRGVLAGEGLVTAPDIPAKVRELTVI